MLKEDPEPSPNELKGEVEEGISGRVGAFGSVVLIRPSREARLSLVRWGRVDWSGGEAGASPAWLSAMKVVQDCEREVSRCRARTHNFGQRKTANRDSAWRSSRTCQRGHERGASQKDAQPRSCCLSPRNIYGEVTGTYMGLPCGVMRRLDWCDDATAWDRRDATLEERKER